QGRKADARRELLEVVRAAPNDAGAPDALLLASELALEGGDLAAGREMVERIVGSYPTHARADFARFNRGLALLREGDAAGAEAERLFTPVRDAGPPDEAAAATYGLAVVAFGKGAAREFRAPAETALATAPRGAAGATRAAPLLYVLTGLAVDDKDWTAASAL